jgi:hypothetical protein
LHPFEPQNYRWDDLWLEQDQGRALREFTQNLLRDEFSEVDKAAVREVCAYFMNLKRNTRLFQKRVDWKSPSARIRSIMDQGARALAQTPLLSPPLRLEKGTSSNVDPRQELVATLPTPCPV